MRFDVHLSRQRLHQRVHGLGRVHNRPVSTVKKREEELRAKLKPSALLQDGQTTIDRQ